VYFYFFFFPFLLLCQSSFELVAIFFCHQFKVFLTLGCLHANLLRFTFICYLTYGEGNYFNPPLSSFRFLSLGLSSFRQIYSTYCLNVLSSLQLPYVDSFCPPPNLFVILFIYLFVSPFVIRIHHISSFFF